MRAALALLLTLTPAAAAAGDHPRVVSLDYCADQFVLALADPEQILGVSVQADDVHSVLRDQAEGHQQVRDAAEDVLALGPDLVIRSYGGDARARALYDRFGVEVFDLGWAGDFDGVRASIRRTAAALGHPERGEALIAEMDTKLAEAANGPRLSALYLTPSGATTGSGTLVAELLEAANFDNAGAAGGAAGWRTLPLERLAAQEPDLVIAAFFDEDAAARDSWSVSRHPVFRRLIGETPSVTIDGAKTTCGAWFLADAALEARRGANAIYARTAGRPPARKQEGGGR
ncbi:MAG: ABC transporter substrate-binding protein [Oceanicaulis sp.]